MSWPWDWIADIFKWIAGAIKKIVKALIDAIKNILKDLWEWVKGFLKGVIETLKDVGEFVFHAVKFEFGKAFKKLWETIGDVVNIVNFSINTIFQILDHATFGAFSKVWDVLSKVVSAIIIVTAAVTGHVEIALAMITTSLLAATGAVRDPVLLLVIYVSLTVVGKIGPIHSGLSKVVDKCKDFVHVSLDKLKYGLSKIYSGGVDILKNTLGDVVSKIGEVLDMTKDEIWSLLRNIAGSIGGTVGKVFDALKSGVDWMIKNVKPLWDWIKDKVNYMWRYVGSGIVDVINWINRKFGTSFRNISGVIKEVATTLLNMSKFIYGKLEKGLISTFNLISRKLGGPVRTLSDALYQILKWINQKGKWVYNFVYDKVAKVWDFMVGAVKDVYAWAKDITASLWNIVKESAINAWTYIKETIQPVWETVKNAAIDAWNYITEKVKPFTDWVKNTIWPTIQEISKTLIDAVDWIEQKGKEVYLWYAAHIKPYLDQVLNLIHKAAIITEMVAAIREGKVVRALLTGIGILGGKIEEVSRNILKFYDGTLTSIMKGIGYSIGWVRKMISDMYRTASIIAEDVAQMGINIGWDVLNEVGAFIADVAKATLGKVYITIGGIEKSVRDWIAYIREPVSRALAIIYQTHAEFHKYDYIYRAAYLRQLSTVTGKPFHYIYLPRIAFEGVK